MAKCEGCGKPARHGDSEGVDLCCECWDSLLAEQAHSLRDDLEKCFRLMLKIRAGELLPKAKKECDREVERLRKIVKGA